MLAINKYKFANFKRPPKRSRADQMPMTFMYLHEYRTHFHIAGSYGISEATACRTISKVGIELVNSGEFRLPGRKVLQPSNNFIGVVLVDVIDQPILRPNKGWRHYNNKKKHYIQ